MDIYLIRHTRPQVAEGICYGQSDLTLADSFDEEWAVLQKKLPAHFDAVYSSPAQRCRLLAERLPTSLHFEEPRLWEMHFGEWEMRPWTEIPSEELQPWMDNFAEALVPGGESFRQVHIRVESFWQELLQKEHSGVAVVAHAGSLRALLCRLLSIPLQKAFIPALDYGKTALVKSRQGILRLEYWNV